MFLKWTEVPYRVYLQAQDFGIKKTEFWGEGKVPMSHVEQIFFPEK